LKKNRRMVLSAVLAAVIVAAGVGAFWFIVMPDVDYWLSTSCRYQQVSGIWITQNYADNSTINGTYIPLNRKNNGIIPATFQITIDFKGADFTTDTSQSYAQVTDSAAKYTFTLGSFEEKAKTYTSP
jgi:hypothetical protein